LSQHGSTPSALPRQPKGFFLSIPLEFIFIFISKAFILKFFIFYIFISLFLEMRGPFFGDGIFRTRSKRSCALGNKTGWGKSHT
jgi:hypothetical protein